jgi:hypothetical protein
MYICNYDSIYESHVENYFLDGKRGYMVMEKNDLFKKYNSDDTLVNDHDLIVGKKLKANDKNSIILFDKTKRRIIIIEYSKR